MDKEFWEERYESDSSIPLERSRFAEYCLGSGKIKPDDLVLEIGHGNGRDAFYFARHGINVIGIDQSGKTVAQPGKTWVNDGKLGLMRGDFVSGSEVMATLMQVVRPDNPKVDHVYSRFTWHSISSMDEERVLSWLPKVLKPGGTVLIECRTVYDDMYGLGKACPFDTYIFEGHRRRFVTPGHLIDRLLENFCVTAELSRGFAPHKNDDPLVLRIQGFLKE